MSGHTPLDSLPLFQDREPVSKLDADFEAFHAKHPEVYEGLVRLARDLKRRGHSKISIKMIFEVYRWEHMTGKAAGDFRLNNNTHSRYARLIMKQEQDLDGFFDTRELRSAS